MKKKLLLAIIATLMVTCGTFAQNKLVATLKHGDSTKYFYGGTALQQAHDAAEDGDIITLSSGVFHEVTLSKSINVRGAGMHRNENEKLDATNIQNVVVADNTSNLSFEGLCINSLYSQNEKSTSDISFNKVKIDNFRNGDNGSCQNWTFINCIILYSSYGNSISTIHFVNSIIAYCIMWSDNSQLFHDNCFVQLGGGSSSDRPIGMRYNSYKNCVICNNTSENAFPNTVSASNCIGIGSVDFANVSEASSNTVLETYEQFFKTYKGDIRENFQQSESFELTNDAKANYLGSDGTQVGIYGGKYPYNTTLSYPQITKAIIDDESVNGKLNVNIELNGGN